MDHSHWSRSTQILCSDWFRSKCFYASSLRHSSLWYKGRKKGLHVLNVGVRVLHSDWLARTGLEHIAVTQTASNTYSAQLVSGARPRNPHSVISSHRDETGWECDLPGLALTTSRRWSWRTLIPISLSLSLSVIQIANISPPTVQIVCKYIHCCALGWRGWGRDSWDLNILSRDVRSSRTTRQTNLCQTEPLRLAEIRLQFSQIN